MKRSKFLFFCFLFVVIIHNSSAQNINRMFEYIEKSTDNSFHREKDDSYIISGTDYLIVTPFAWGDDSSEDPFLDDGGTEDDGSYNDVLDIPLGDTYVLLINLIFLLLYFINIRYKLIYNNKLSQNEI